MRNNGDVLRISGMRDLQAARSDSGSFLDPACCPSTTLLCNHTLMGSTPRTVQCSSKGSQDTAATCAGERHTGGGLWPSHTAPTALLGINPTSVHLTGNVQSLRFAEVFYFQLLDG